MIVAIVDVLTSKDVSTSTIATIIWLKRVFSVETDAFQVCVIQGNQEGAQLAESLIHDIIVNQPLIETLKC